MEIENHAALTLSHVVHESQWLSFRSGIFPVAELHTYSEFDAEILQLLNLGFGFWISGLISLVLEILNSAQVVL